MSVAAVIMMRERRLVARFRDSGATEPGTAQALTDLRGVDEIALRRLRKRAVIREATAGSYYLDEPSWAALRGTRRRIMVVLTAVGLAIALFAYLGLGR